MKAPTYRRALNELLTPLGFVIQTKDNWVRRVGDVEECIDLQRSAYGLGVTVNIWSVDLVSRKMLEDAVPPGAPGLKYWVSERLGHFLGPYDKWWKGDPNGPAVVAEAVREHALPFLERMRPLEAQADRLGRRGVGQGVPHISSRLQLAVTLYRMGEREEACRALMIPKRRTEIPAWAAQVQPLRDFLGCSPMDGLAGS
jgi:hypothetical protein